MMVVLMLMTGLESSPDGDDYNNGPLMRLEAASYQGASPARATFHSLRFEGSAIVCLARFSSSFSYYNDSFS